MKAQAGRRSVVCGMITIGAVFIAVNGCNGGAAYGEECDGSTDCRSDLTCVTCASNNACAFSDQTSGSSRDNFCKLHGGGPPGGGGSSSGGSSSRCGAGDVWTCSYDGQATTTCQYACSLSGSQRSQTCQVLGQMMDKSPGSCCKVCK